MTQTPGYCAHCGAAHSGGRWCATCGSRLPDSAQPGDPTVLVPAAAWPESAAPPGPVPARGPVAPAGPATAPNSQARPRTLPVVLVVATILVLGLGSFVGARWWLSRGEDAVASTPASIATAEPPSANGARPGKNAAAPTGGSVVASAAATPVPSTVIATATVTAVVTPAPAPTPIVTTPAATVPTVESIGGVRRHDIGCDASYIVVLGSALDAGSFADTAAGLGARFPGTNYLISGSSCFNFRSQSAYVLYEGPFTGVGTACAARFAGTRDAYVKVADLGATDRTVSCLCPPPAALPDLGVGDQGAYVTEAQYALQRLGLYAGDGTGTFDGDTEQAVRAFQAGRSLPADGRLTATTWPALTAADCEG